MGAVDLVIQVESPKSVARGLQRIGRAGHSRRRRQPRADLPEVPRATCSSARWSRGGCATGEIETTVVPRNALDVLAQQIVAIAAAAPEDEPVAVDDLLALVTRHLLATPSSAARSSRTCSTCSTAATRRSEFAELRPRIVWDRVAGTIRARPGARQLAVTNAGTIPDRGLYAVTLPDGRRVGELDEEMVYEARPGQTFLLGATHLADRGDRPRPRDRHAGARAAGRGAVLEGRRDRAARRSSARRSARSRGGLSTSRPRVLERDYDLDAARGHATWSSSCASSSRPPAWSRRDRAIVVERFRDEIGDWRLCVLSPVRRPRPRRLGRWR